MALIMAEIYGIRIKGEQWPIYVGSTKYTTEERFKTHLLSLKAHKHRNKAFQAKALDVGIDNIECYLIERVDGSPIRREYEIINEYRTRGIPLTNRSTTTPHNAPETDPLSANLLAKNIILALTAPEACETVVNQRLYSALRKVARKAAISLVKDNGAEVLAILRGAIC